MSKGTDPFEVFDKVLGRKPSKPNVDPLVAANVWMERTPIFKKLPADGEQVISIKAGDFRRVMRQAFVAGFERAMQ